MAFMLNTARLGVTCISYEQASMLTRHLKEVGEQYVKCRRVCPYDTLSGIYKHMPEF